MNRHRTYGPLDDVSEIVGDGAFLRLDMLADPATLPEGTLAASENMRFDAQGTTVRGGLARQFPVGTNIGTILHAGIYKPDRGDDQLALVTARTLVLFAPESQTVTTYNFPGGESIAAGDRIDTIQAGLGSGTLPTLYLLRGFAADVLKYDTGVITAVASFQRGEFGLFYQDRIAVNSDTQSVAVSDFLDFATFRVLNQFQILKGGDDYLVMFLPYQKDYVLVGTRKSWAIAFFDPIVGVGTDGYDGSLTDSSFLRQLTREAGPVGPRAAVEALGYIWFIADNAIYAFAPQLDNQLTVLGKPISAEIQPVMDRMNTRYARGACVERYGYRLYFAMPINDEPVSVVGLTVVGTVTIGVDLPFDLPVNLVTGAIVTVETATPHNLGAEDRVQIAGALTSGLNGEFPVASVMDAFHYTYTADVAAGAATGDRITLQRLATRNNTIAVYNLNNRAWESIDTLPAGFFADWLRVADYGTRRRLWVIDADSGPALYEEREADETGEILGGISLPFDLPVEFSEVNLATVPIRGRLLTRAFRWGAFPRKVRQAEARATLPAGSALTMSLLARTPNNRLWTGERAFSASQFETEDAPLRKICGERALEAQVELITTGGRPTIRSVLVETAAVGKVEE